MMIQHVDLKLAESNKCVIFCFIFLLGFRLKAVI